ncbi:MAG: zinc-dependent metalloprotease [Actinomycetota bacterium]|nr:zinc-dependent metalloprotease [Actinomycetota bacterium]
MRYPIDPSEIGKLLSQLGQMMQGAGNAPVGWSAAVNMARTNVVQAGDPSVNDSEIKEINTNVQLAQTWLNGVTTVPAASTTSKAWCRSEWIEATVSTWQKIVDPVAQRVQNSMSNSLPNIPGVDESQQEMLKPLLDALKPMSAAMFSMQISNGLAALSSEVLCLTDIGIPLGDTTTPALIPRNIKEFAKGLNINESEIIAFVALRESAASRLFSNINWLAPTLLGAIEEYSSQINVDSNRISELMGQIDPTNPLSIQEALSGGLFEPQLNASQTAALMRTERLLALIEGWIYEVVNIAALGRLPGIAALQEAMIRRRASGGPAEKTFGALIGLELRPKLIREAAQFWNKQTLTFGTNVRDSLWNHPDLLPSIEELQDPQFFNKIQAPLDISSLDSAGIAPKEPDDQTDDGNSSSASK